MLKSAEVRRKIEELDKKFNCAGAQININIELFKQSAMAGNQFECERLREIVVTLQGGMMDDLYARVVLMKQAGFIK